jgi:hypothetical protein
MDFKVSGGMGSLNTQIRWMGSNFQNGSQKNTPAGEAAELAGVSHKYWLIWRMRSGVFFFLFFFRFSVLEQTLSIYLDCFQDAHERNYRLA